MSLQVIGSPSFTCGILQEQLPYTFDGAFSMLAMIPISTDKKVIPRKHLRSWINAKKKKKKKKQFSKVGSIKLSN